MFTPAPWEYLPAHKGFVITARERSYDIAVVRNIGADDNTGNAHLIATAPELYSSTKMALEAINKLAEEYGAIPEYLDDITSVLEVSLAKARGES